jgi:TetR/AcrR family transcriptional repressor of nem operon
MRKGEETRERILEIAESSVLAKGFGATSIEEVIAEAGITKSGFFYHFKDKSELARAMMLRYVEKNDRIFDDVFDRGRQLSDDPLQSFLITLKLLAEVMGDLPNGHPGCLLATFVYQERLFDREVRALTTDEVRKWSERFRAALAGVAEAYPPQDTVDINDVGDMFSCLIDGSIIMSRALGDSSILQRQILAFRSFVKMLFTPAAQAAMPRPAVVAAE